MHTHIGIYNFTHTYTYIYDIPNLVPLKQLSYIICIPMRYHTTFREVDKRLVYNSYLWKFLWPKKEKINSFMSIFYLINLLKKKIQY